MRWCREEKFNRKFIHRVKIKRHKSWNLFWVSIMVFLSYEFELTFEIYTDPDLLVFGVKKNWPFCTFKEDDDDDTSKIFKLCSRIETMRLKKTQTQTSHEGLSCPTPFPERVWLRFTIVLLALTSTWCCDRSVLYINVIVTRRLVSAAPPLDDTSRTYRYERRRIFENGLSLGLG